MKNLNSKVEEDLLKPKYDASNKDSEDGEFEDVTLVKSENALVKNSECNSSNSVVNSVKESTMYNETTDNNSNIRNEVLKNGLMGQLYNPTVIEDLVLSHKLNKSFIKKLLQSNQTRLEAIKKKKDRPKKSITATPVSKIYNTKSKRTNNVRINTTNYPRDVSPTSSKLNLLQINYLEEIKEESEIQEAENPGPPIQQIRNPTAIRWIGVNGHEHDVSQPTHTGESTSDDNQHYHVLRSPNTPHIIVSPDADDEASAPNYPSDEQNESTSQVSEDPFQTREVTAQTIEDAPVSSSTHPGSATPVTTKNSTIVNFENEKTVTDELSGSCSDIYVKNKSETKLNRNSPESPKDDQPQSLFFNTPEMPVEDGQLPEYQLRNSLASPQKYDNNPFRSMSMANLELLDPCMRKTRRNSMMGMMRRVSSTSNVALPQSHVPRSTSKISLTSATDWKMEMNESLILYISALYGKLLVVMGMAFPMAEVISKDVPLIFYNSFYLYLYFGSILFLIYAYLFLLRAKSFATTVMKHKMHKMKKRLPRVQINWSNLPLPITLQNYMTKRTEQKSEKDEKMSINASTYKPPKYTITESSNHGSMYLKMGAVIFGIGSMIYSGLEFGQYFELRSDSECANILMAITPVARMIFTFLQMYFIFLNSRVAISKHTIIARFGLMHMVGTNLCIWLNVLVQETKHEIVHLTHKAMERKAGLGSSSSHLVHDHHLDKALNSVLGDDHHDDGSSEDLFTASTVAQDLYDSTSLHSIVKRTGTTFVDDLFGCRRINLMGHVVSSASPFLFPCTIEYSLLCAGVLYVMWKNINVNRSEKSNADGDSDVSTFIARKIRHHYSVDCARASRGLFMGIFVLVLTIISLILFYVLISNEQLMEFAILEANIVELSIYSVAIISVIIGMKQMRELEFILDGDIELDNILLIIAQAGVYIYTSFTIIGGYFNMEETRTLPLLTAVITLVQTTLQTLFILDGSRRCCYTPDQLDRKPGRETVTFLLVCNLAMWAISTFETSRADVHPVQLHFYGIWAWTIISHVSMPLAIFYRFHVTVCLGEIWKRSYKMKNDYIGL